MTLSFPCYVLQATKGLGICLWHQTFAISVPKKLWTYPVLDSSKFTQAVTWVSENHLQAGHATVTLLCWDKKRWKENITPPPPLLQWCFIAFFFSFWGKNAWEFFNYQYWSHTHLWFCSCNIHSHSENTLSCIVYHTIYGGHKAFVMFSARETSFNTVVLTPTKASYSPARWPSSLVYPFLLHDSEWPRNLCGSFYSSSEGIFLL